MIVINFSHPLSDEQIGQLEAVLDEPPERIIAVPVQLDLAGTTQSLLGQVVGLVDRVGLAPEQWFKEDIAVNLPGHSLAAALVLAELHGRMGYFPPVVRMRPVPGALPPHFEVADIIDLAAVRAAAAGVDY